MSVYLDRPPVDEALFVEIVQRVLSVADAERIIVFGSAAMGTMTEDSDIDLLVLKRDLGNAFHESIRIHESLESTGHAYDVFVMQCDRFERQKKVIGTLAHPANKYGKVLYDRSG